MILSLAACARGPSDADRREIERIAAVRDSLRVQLNSLERESSVPRESVLGAVREVRRQIVGVTDDLLRQRAEALAAGARFRYEAPSFQALPERADSLEREIARLRDSLRANQARVAGQMQGSIARVLAELEIETQQMTVSMLEMARLSAEYGIGLPAFQVDSPRVRR